MSIEQRSQHYNTSQQTDRASPYRRSVSQHNLSSSPEHIALGFEHRRLLTGSDRRSPIGHIARLGHVACSVTHRSACSVTPSTSTSRYFITSLFFFFPLWLSQSLSLFIWKIKMKWNLKWNEMELSLYSFKTLTVNFNNLSNSFE